MDAAGEDQETPSTVRAATTAWSPCWQGVSQPNHLAGEPVLCAHAPNASWQAARRSDSAELIGSGRLRRPLRGGYWGCWGLLERGSKRVDKWMLNLTACAHKQIEHTFGSWHTGVEMSDWLLAWWRHSYTQHISERRRPGFPKIGHSQTWLIDKVQLLVEKNHDTLAFPHWSNESDYARTAEKFSTVPLHTVQLGAAVQAIADVNLVDMELTRNEKYIANAMGVKVPFLPVCGKDEKKLFCGLVALAGAGPGSK